MPPLTEKQKKHLRALGHKLKPVVMVGDAGLSDSVLEELDRSLTRHELLKVRVNAGDRAEREQMIARMCDHTKAQLVQRVGHIALLFRRNPKRPRISLK